MSEITKEMIEAAKAAYWHEAHNGGGYSDKCYEAAISAALSSRSAEAGKPVVKALEWASSALDTQYGLIIRIGKTPFGVYKILKGTQNRYEVYFGDAPYSGSMDNEDQAKAWAQSDYESRILSALATPVADIEPVSVPDGERRQGFYWIKASDGWEPWKWTPKGWTHDFVASYYTDEEIGEIGPYIPFPLAAAPQPNPSRVDAEAWEKLCKLTFAVQHNPNCASQWLVRLPGKGPIDMKPYGDPLGLVRHQTGDILGFGKTLSDAARAALAAQGEKQP